MSLERASSRRAFLGVVAMFFVASASVTVAWCTSMSVMDGMRMPGGWTMSMVWMRVPGQTWPGAAASFLAMWTVMTVAMMLPSLVPMLWRYRQLVRGTGATRPGWLTALVGMAYFLTWTVGGAVVFPLGVVTSEIAMRHPSLSHVVPVAAGLVVLVAGILQFTTWKARRLAHCPDAEECGDPLPANAGAAWRHGLRLGVDCAQCCAGLMAIPLVVGIMDLRVMSVVAAAITAERLAADRLRVARAVGVVVVAVGLVMVARAAAVG